MNRNNLPADTLLPPPGALKKMSGWARKHGLVGLASFAHKDHTETPDNKSVQQLLDDLEIDFSDASGKEAGKLWDGVSTFTPAVVRKAPKPAITKSVFANGVPHIIGSSFTAKYLTLSLTELENGLRTVIVSPHLEPKQLRIYEFLREHANSTNQEKVIAALSRDGHRVLNTVVYKIVDGELEARQVKADSTPVWARTLLDAVVQNVERPQYLWADVAARFSFPRLLGNVLRRRFTKIVDYRSSALIGSDSSERALAMTANAIGGEVVGMRDKHQHVASYGNRKVVRLI